MREVLKRLKLAWNVLWSGTEAVYRPIRQEIKKARDVQYFKMMQEAHRAKQEKDAAIKERDNAISTMHLIANDALRTIKELESALVSKKESSLDSLLSLYPSTKDDLPN